MMKDHIYKEGKTKTDENTYYCKYDSIVDGGIGLSTSKKGSTIEQIMKSNTFWSICKNGIYMKSVTDVCCSSLYPISCELKYTKKRGASKEYTDILAPMLYGTKDELENWKYFVFNNKLPLFLNICLIIDQNNTSKGFIPWITNKRYTDSEIYKLLNINENEQNLIDSVIQKFERNSTWFKRYMIGSENV